VRVYRAIREYDLVVIKVKRVKGWKHMGYGLYELRSLGLIGILVYLGYTSLELCFRGIKG
jgi:hypothetical protein